MISFSTLRYASFSWRFLNIFPTSSTSLGKSSDIPNPVPLGRFLMKDLMKNLSWNSVGLTIIGRGWRLRPFDCERCDVILWTLSKWMFSSSTERIFSFVRMNYLRASLVSLFVSFSRSFFPKNFIFPLRLWHSSLTCRRCSSLSSRSMRSLEVLAASCLKLTSLTMAFRSSISACEFSKFVCRALFSSSRRVILFLLVSNSGSIANSVLSFSSIPESLEFVVSKYFLHPYLWCWSDALSSSVWELPSLVRFLPFFRGSLFLRFWFVRHFKWIINIF